MVVFLTFPPFDDGGVTPAKRLLPASRNTSDQLVIPALGDTFVPTQNSYALLTAQAFQDNTYLLFR